MEIKIKCPICGNIDKIEIKIIEGFDGFLDYDPPEKYAVFNCSECKFNITSEWTKDLNFPDINLIEEVKKKLIIPYSKEDIEKVGKLCLFYLGTNLKWEEILHRLRSLENLIYVKK